jgi:hypothetical protein
MSTVEEKVLHFLSWLNMDIVYQHFIAFIAA